MANGTTEEQTNILKLVAGMFNAAPGARYLWEVETAFGAVGWDYSALARGLSQTTFFKSLYPSDLSTQAFADKFLGTLGLADVADAQQWIRYHATAGKPYAQLMLEALVALDASSDAVYASARQLLANKATVAEHYSVTQAKSGYEMGTLQGVLAMVRPDSNLSILSMDALIKAGIEAANAQQPALLIADDRGVQTLNDWQPGQEVLIQGTNQPYENGSPVYELSTVAGEKAPALKITLDKSVFLRDGIALDALFVAANAGAEPGASSVRALELVVVGEAYTEYSVGSLRAEGVNELRLSGGADFWLCVDAMDTQDLLIDGSAMQGKLTLSLDAEMLSRFLEAAKTGSVQLIGGQSQHDILYLGEFDMAPYKTLAPLTVKGIETINFTNIAEFDVAKTQGVKLYKNANAMPLLLTNLSSQTAVSRGTEDGAFGFPLIFDSSNIDPYTAPYGSDQGFVTEQYSADSVLNFELVGGRGHKLQTDGFESLSIDVRVGRIWNQVLAEQRFDLSEQTYDKATGKWLAGTDASDIAAGAPVPLNHISKIELHKLSITSDLYDVINDWSMEGLKGQTNKVTLGTLLSTINVLDVSGYSGQVVATLGARETAMVGAVKFDSGDVLVKVGTYGLDITDDHSVARITTFEFTTDAKIYTWEFEALQWKITGFQTAHKDVSGTVTDATVLDISALGVRGLAGLSLEQKGADLHIRAKDVSKAFEILLAGVDQTDLKVENFKFV